ncbi:hypothetical protein NDK25_23730 [Niallia taxi]|nr:hypothetical protein [Niallia taxi]MDE5055229.1 hypothetical protein [Niallia taxi]
MSNTFEFIEVTLNDGENTGLLLKNSKQTLVNRKDALEYIEKLLAAYNNPSVEQFIETHNNQTQAELNMEYTMRATLLNWIYDDEKNQYLINEPLFKMKEFRKDLKQDWSFRCATCNKKISSSTDSGYFLVRAGLSQDCVTEKACSSACCSVIWREKVHDWLKDKGYQDNVKIKRNP